MDLAEEMTVEEQPIGVQQGSEVDVYGHLVLQSHGSAQLRIKTGLFGVMAARMRDRLERESSAEWEEHLLRWAEERYGALRAFAPPMIKDHPEENCLFMEEYYEVLDPMASGKISICPFKLMDCLRSIDLQVTDPLPLQYPFRGRELVCLELPEGLTWDVQEKRHSWKETALRIGMHRTVQNNQLLVDYRFETLRDHITVDEIGKVCNTLSEVEQTFNQGIRTPHLQQEQAVTATPVIEVAAGHPILFGASAIGVYLGVTAFLSILKNRLSKSAN